MNNVVKFLIKWQRVCVNSECQIKLSEAIPEQSAAALHVNAETRPRVRRYCRVEEVFLHYRGCLCDSTV